MTVRDHMAGKYSVKPLPPGILIFMTPTSIAILECTNTEQGHVKMILA